MAKIIRISREEAKRRLGDVQDDKRFWCHDGRLLKNLGELQRALGEMGDDTFQYHSSQGRADFGNWVREVVGDDKLAKDLIKAKSRVQASKAVADRISFLRSRA